MNRYRFRKSVIFLLLLLIKMKLLITKLQTGRLKGLE